MRSLFYSDAFLWRLLGRLGGIWWLVHDLAFWIIQLLRSLFHQSNGRVTSAFAHVSQSLGHLLEDGFVIITIKFLEAGPVRINHPNLENQVLSDVLVNSQPCRVDVSFNEVVHKEALEPVNLLLSEPAIQSLAQMILRH